MTTSQGAPAAPVSRHQAVVRSLLGIAEGVRGVMERDLESRGITLQQYNVLRILADAGDAGLPTLAVAEHLLERAPGITRLMDRLERQGLVARNRGTDRRQVFCSLTADGAAVVEDLQPRMTEAASAAVGCLNPNELAALLHFLNRIRSRLPADD
jgi:DNA-binding MarR family transcriptional regulator